MDFGMFTSEGNIAVFGIVQYAKETGLDWQTVHQNLVDLANYDPAKYGEATDTVVREMVYDAIGAGERGEDFYV